MSTMSTKRESDWKKIAGDRLQRLRQMERQCTLLRVRLAEELKRELSIHLHAHCFPSALYADKLGTIAESVAERVRPHVP